MPLSPNPVGMAESLTKMRERGADAIVYMGYGYSTFHFSTPSTRSAGTRRWAPRSCSTRTPTSGRRASRANGVDQLGEDGANPNYEALLQRFRKRFGRDVGNVVVAGLRHRAAVHGIANATIAIPKEVKLGLEKIKWMPCANGGPGTYVTSRRTTTGVTRATS